MNELSSSDQDIIQLSLEKGLIPLSMYRNDFDFFPRALALMQTYVYEGHPEKLATAPDQELQEMASILRIADWFDRMTAMNSGHEPMSEIAAMQYFKKYPKKFLPVLVTALAECIHIIPKAASVDLSTGDKGIVLIENTRDFMRPVVLRLSDNQIYDLSDKNVYQEMQVTDIMKTMDNRVAMDEETLKQFVPDENLLPGKNSITVITFPMIYSWGFFYFSLDAFPLFCYIYFIRRSTSIVATTDEIRQIK